MCLVFPEPLGQCFSTFYELRHIFFYNGKIPWHTTYHTYYKIRPTITIWSLNYTHSVLRLSLLNAREADILGGSEGGNRLTFLLTYNQSTMEC